MVDRLGGAFGNTSVAVDAVVGVDVDHVLVFVKTFHWANGQASFIFTANAGLSDDHGHVRNLILS